MDHIHVQLMCRVGNDQGQYLHAAGVFFEGAVPIDALSGLEICPGVQFSGGGTIGFESNASEEAPVAGFEPTTSISAFLIILPSCPAAQLPRAPSTQLLVKVPSGQACRCDGIY